MAKGKRSEHKLKHSRATKIVIKSLAPHKNIPPRVAGPRFFLEFTIDTTCYFFQSFLSGFLAFFFIIYFFLF